MAMLPFRLIRNGNDLDNEQRRKGPFGRRTHCRRRCQRHSPDAAAEAFAANGGRVLIGPMDIPIGRLAIVEDPFGNRLVLLDSTKGTYDTDESGAVTGVS